LKREIFDSLERKVLTVWKRKILIQKVAQSWCQIVTTENAFSLKKFIMDLRDFIALIEIININNKSGGNQL
jgi:hypothetical protein